MKVFKLIKDWSSLKEYMRLSIHAYEATKALVDSYDEPHRLEAKAKGYDTIVLNVDLMLAKMREYLD